MSAPSDPPTDTTAPTDHDLAFAGVARLSELLQAGEVTPRELVDLYLARIERLDPQLNAFVSVRGDAAWPKPMRLRRLRRGRPTDGGADRRARQWRNHPAVRGRPARGREALGGPKATGLLSVAPVRSRAVVPPAVIRTGARDVPVYRERRRDP